MESVTGWCFQLALAVVGAAYPLLSGAVMYCLGNVLVTWRAANFTPKLPFVIRLLELYACTVAVMLTHWWIAMDEWKQHNVKWLFRKRVRMLPFWGALHWLHSLQRAIKLGTAAAVTVACSLVIMYTAPALSRAAGDTASDAAPVLHTHSAMPLSLTVTFGVVLAVSMVTAGLDVVDYPPIHLKRRARESARVPTILQHALAWWTVSVLASLVVCSALEPGLVSALRGRLHAVVSAFGAMLLYCLALAYGLCRMNVLLSERVAVKTAGGHEGIEHAQVLDLLVHRLQTLKEPLNTAITLQELAIRSRLYGLHFWRDVFSDNISIWAPLSDSCVAQLQQLCECSAAYAAAQKAEATETKAAKWWDRAVLVSGAALRPTPPLREQVVLEAFLRRRERTCIWAAQVLTDIAVLSCEHDTSSLLLFPPDGVYGLAAILRVLVHAYAALDHFGLYRRPHKQRTLRSLPIMRRAPLLSYESTAQHAGDAGTAIHGCLAICLNRMRCTFDRQVLLKLRNALGVRMPQLPDTHASVGEFYVSMLCS